jgi:hypothetical protein
MVLLFDALLVNFTSLSLARLLKSRSGGRVQRLATA